MNIKFLQIAIIGMCCAIANQAKSESLEKTYITKAEVKYHAATQQRLQQSVEWRSFVQRHPGWMVHFNEHNQLPHRAYGSPIAVAGNTLAEKAARFLQQEYPKAFLQLNGFKKLNEVISSKYQYLNYVQLYNGLEILNSRLTFKFTLSGDLVMFGCDIIKELNVSTLPQLNPQSAINFASVGITDRILSNTMPELKILAIPRLNTYEYKLVYALNVTTFDQNKKEPGDYYTLVDAVNGALLYRTNKVLHISPEGEAKKANQANVALKGTIYPKHVYSPTAVVGMPYAKVTIGASSYNTDNLGNLTIANTPATATLELRGPWSKVTTTQNTVNTPIVPSFTTTITDTTTTISWDNKGTAPNNTSIRHLSAYYHVNVVHDSLVSWMPGNTSMNFSLLTVVDRTDGNCNAFYTGSPTSINFYTLANGCNALSQVNDVIYHEYGHGITNNWYINGGLSFDNGAMGEGYSDVFAIAITNDPVLGIGFSTTNPATFIRRYDQNWKVYPQDLIGEVHADGEIIAGAWWHTAQKINDMGYTIRLLCESLYGYQNAPNGMEGELYTDILVDALMADDTDSNISNGTPNGLAIIHAFGMHGIGLLTNAQFDHIPVTTANGNTPIDLNAIISVASPFNTFFNEARVYYRTAKNATWDSLSFSAASSSSTNYKATIPAQPNGTLIAYYVCLADVFGNKGNIQPPGASDDIDPNLPYFIIVGSTRQAIEDFDNNQSVGWLSGITGDNATTGQWVIDAPTESTINGVTVQTGLNYTPGGTICAVTANAPNATDPPGTADVDNGWTRLESPTLNMSAYIDPILSYQRWFTNDQGAQPGTDGWYTWISNDNGTTWTAIEKTLTPDHSWRQMAIRIKDYINPTALMKVRFMAVDSASNGGSLIEAAVDDIEIWDKNATSTQPLAYGVVNVNLYPNPAQESVFVDLNLNIAQAIRIAIVDMEGKIVYQKLPVTLMSGKHTLTLPIQNLPAGEYLVTIDCGNSMKQIPFIVKQ